MRRLLLISFVLLSFTGCAPYFNFLWDTPEEKDPPPTIAQEPIIDSILSYSVELKHEKQLHLMDAKIYYSENVETLRLHYITQDIFELCEARGLLVDMVEGLLDKLNTRPGAREQTEFNQYTAANLDICIEFESFFIRYVDPAYIGWISLRNGKSTFYSGDTNNYRLDSWHARTEPYYKTLLYVNIERAAEANYRLTHPDPEDDQPYFGRGEHEPVDWFVR